MRDFWIYVAGFLTPFLLCTIVFVGIVLFSRSGVSTGPCQVCDKAGIKTKWYDFNDRSYLTYHVQKWWHGHVTSRRKPHKIAWQQWQDSRAKYVRTPPTRAMTRKFGVPVK